MPVNRRRHCTKIIKPCYNEFNGTEIAHYIQQLVINVYLQHSLITTFFFIIANNLLYSGSTVRPKYENKGYFLSWHWQSDTYTCHTHVFTGWHACFRQAFPIKQVCTVSKDELVEAPKRHQRDSAFFHLSSINYTVFLKGQLQRFFNIY